MTNRNKGRPLSKEHRIAIGLGVQKRRDEDMKLVITDLKRKGKLP